MKKQSNSLELTRYNKVYGAVITTYSQQSQLLL